MSVRAASLHGFEAARALKCQLSSSPGAQMPHTDIQTYRHTDIQTYRHTDIRTYIPCIPCIHTYIHTYMCISIHLDLVRSHRRGLQSPGTPARLPSWAPGPRPLIAPVPRGGLAGAQPPLPPLPPPPATLWI